MTTVLRLLLAATTCVLLTGCALDAVPTLSPGSIAPSPVPPSPTVIVSHGTGAAPPPFLVRYDSVELRLSANTYCTHHSGVGTCADGFDDSPPSIGSPEDVFVFVPVAEFDHLDATLSVPNDTGEAIAVPTTPVGGHWWRLQPKATNDTYRMSIFASGDSAGNMAADVIWTSPAK